MQRNRRIIFIITGVILLTIIIVLILYFFIFQHTVTPPGQYICQDLSDAQISFINDNISNTELKHDVTISQTTTIQKYQNPENQNSILFDIKVPITDFYNPKTSIKMDDITDDILISISDLNYTNKLLAIESDSQSHYYFDDFQSGAIFIYLTFSGDEEDINNIFQATNSSSLPDFPDQSTTLSLAQTGVTALSRNMTTKLNSVGDTHYFATKIATYLSHFDLTHTSNEASFSTSANSTNICSLPQMIDVLTDIGLDIVELTGNHNLDCGAQAAIETYNIYTEHNIKTIGGGINADSAAVPLKIDLKDNQITMLAYNLSTGGYTLDESPGANFYTEEKAIQDIANAKAENNFIIVDIQYYECNNYDNTVDDRSCDYADSSAGNQIEFFRHLIDLGADIVVGTAAHQPQTFELYQNKPIYYGLGNLFFDQAWWPGTTRSLILENYFYKGKLLQTRITPTIYDQNLQVELMNNAETITFVTRLLEARPN